MMMMMTAMIFSSNVKGTTISSVVTEYPVKSLLSVPSSDSYWVVIRVYIYLQPFRKTVCWYRTRIDPV